ncbi:MAG: toxin [Bacteroidota bacterium]
MKSDTSLEDVENFLNRFHPKLGIFNIIFRNRDKNIQALLDLEITPDKRLKIIENLKPIDYYGGPEELIDFPGQDCWEFGVNYKDAEIYIKISLGNLNNSTICISFHRAERKMKFPYK